MAALKQNLNRALVLFELTPASYIRFADCQQEDFEQVLHRPIETAGVIGMWLFRPRPIFQCS
jgi:hypothetical protein